MSAPIIVGAVAGATPLLFEASTSIALLTVVPVGMWAKVSISPPSELAREAGEAQPVGNADRFYNQAQALEASRAMQKFLLSLRHGTVPR